MKKTVFLVFIIAVILAFTGCSKDIKDKENKKDIKQEPIDAGYNDLIPDNDTEFKEANRTMGDGVPIIVFGEDTYLDYCTFKNYYPEELEKELKPGETYIYKGPMGWTSEEYILTIRNKSKKTLPAYKCDVVALESKEPTFITAYEEGSMMIKGDITTMVEGESPWYGFTYQHTLSDSTVVFEYPVTEGCILNLLFYVEDINDGVISYRYEGFKLVSSREIGPALKYMSGVQGYDGVLELSKDMEVIYPAE